MSGTILKITAEHLSSASICPMRYWHVRCSRSTPDKWSAHEAIEHCIRYAARKFWQQWIDTKEKPNAEMMRILASREYISKFKGNEKLADNIVKRLGIACNIFVSDHPNVTPMIVGTQFETTYQREKQTGIIKGSIDLICKTSKGNESLIVITSDGIRDNIRLRETITQLGYKSVSKGATPHSIHRFTEGAGFESIRIRQPDLKEFEQAVELVTFLQASRNRTKHTGLACNACGYKLQCNGR